MANEEDEINEPAGAGTSWAPAIGAAGSSSDTPVHPAIPTNEHAMDVELRGGGGRGAGGSSGGSSLVGGDAMEGAAAPPTRRMSPPSTVGGNASVIPVHGGRALLTIEVRSKKRKYGCLGGKAEVGETLAKTADREAFQESGRCLSNATRTVISALEPSDFTLCRRASMHVAVALVGDDDCDVHSKFNEELANRPGSKTKQVGIEWLDIKNLLNARRRAENMHFHVRAMIEDVGGVLVEHDNNA